MLSFSDVKSKHSTRIDMLMLPWPLLDCIKAVVIQRPPAPNVSIGLPDFRDIGILGFKSPELVADAILFNGLLNRSPISRVEIWVIVLCPYAWVCSSTLCMGTETLAA